MIFGKLIFENFMAIAEAEIDLSGRGLLLIQGENTIETSASSNGAGKSTIPDGACWCLYGTTARDISGDAVINREAKKGTKVSIEVIDGPVIYTVARYRKHATHKNALMVSQLDTTTGTVTDLSKGTDKETQEVVNAIMGCSLDVFVGAIYAGQEKMPNLPGMTDKQLKSVIEEAAGTEVLAEAYAEARQRLLTVKGKIEGAVARLTEERNRKPALAEELKSIEEKQAEFDAGRKVRASAKLAEVAPVQKQLDADNEELGYFDVAAVTAEQDSLQGALMGRQAEEKELEEMLAHERVAQRAVDAISTDITSTVATKKRLVEQLAEVEHTHKADCDTCGRPFAEHEQEAAKEHRRAHINGQIQAITDRVPALKQKSEDAAAALKTASERVSARRATMTDVSATVARSGELRGILSRVAALNNAITTGNGQIEVIRAAAKAFLTEPNPWANAADIKKADIAKNEENVTKMEAALKAGEAELALYEEAVRVFGPAGVRAHILDTVTPFLNDRTRDYLGALSDGNISAVWSTLSKTSKGELREKFNIEVTSATGGESFNSLSGGEKRKVRLATTMALQDLVASRAIKSLGLFIADEIDHALDPAGLERLMGMLERKARERGTVLVVSHNSLADWIPNEITVTKVGKSKSVVSGATHHGI